jgi:hypothetical protein
MYPGLMVNFGFSSNFLSFNLVLMLTVEGEKGWSIRTQILLSDEITQHVMHESRLLRSN